MGHLGAILGLSRAISAPSWARHAILYVVVSRRSWYVVLRAISQFVVTRTSWYLVLCGASPTSWYLVLRGIEAVCGISASSYPVLLGISHFEVARTSWQLVLFIMMLRISLYLVLRDILYLVSRALSRCLIICFTTASHLIDIYPLFAPRFPFHCQAGYGKRATSEVEFFFKCVSN